MALAKEMFQNFSNKSLPRAIGRPSAKDPSLPRALVIALGKEAEIYFVFVFLHSIDTSISYIYIYIYQPSHIYITQNPFSHNISQP